MHEERQANIRERERDKCTSKMRRSKIETLREIQRERKWDEEEEGKQRNV